MSTTARPAPSLKSRPSLALPLHGSQEGRVGSRQTHNPGTRAVPGRCPRTGPQACPVHWHVQTALNSGAALRSQAHRVTAKKMAPLYAGLASLLRKSSAAAVKAADSRGSTTGCLVLRGSAWSVGGLNPVGLRGLHLVRANQATGWFD